MSAPMLYDSAQSSSAMVQELIAVWRYRDLLGELIVRNIKVRYKRSLLGLAWTMLNPLLMMAILTLVFSNLFRIALDRYPIYVLSALVLWNFFAQTTTTAMTELVWGGSLIQRIYVPRTVFALAAVGTGIVNLLFALVPLALIVIFSGGPLRPALIFLPIPILLAALFALGIGLILSVLAISFADVIDIYQVVLSAWFYLTPIIYPQDILPAPYQAFFNFNPMVYLIEIFRAPIYAGALPELNTLLIATALALTTLLGGWWFFARNADALAYRV